MQTYPQAPIPFPVTRIAYGCMKIGGRWDREPHTAAERATGFAAVGAALAQGINFFDHADIYCRGKSETVFGEFLREHPGLREKIVVQSKCGIIFADDPEPGAPHRFDFSREHIVRSAEDILRRLGTDYLDIYLLHRPDPLVEPAEVAAAFDELHRAGKVRGFGVSNHTAGQIELLRQFVNQPIVANQLEVSLYHHGLVSDGFLANQHGHPYSHTAGTLDYCRLHGIRVQAWSPIGGGGKLFGPLEGLAENLRPCRELLEKLAAERGVTPEAIALAWLLRHPAGIQPIIGSLRPERIADAGAADTVELTRYEWYALLEGIRGKDVP
jgi:predicted oxidoreductase